MKKEDETDQVHAVSLSYSVAGRGSSEASYELRRMR
jgi:hypothetical protein